MKKLKIIVFGLLVLLASNSYAQKNAPTGLLCELLEHPEQTMITDRQPEFGWIYHPSSRNDIQTGYRILVSSQRTDVEAGRGNLWDSGWVTNAASINIPYGGLPLQPGSSYFWRVQTLDDAGRQSAFSKVQQFNMAAQLSPAAMLPLTTDGLKWVWFAASPESRNTTRYFRTTFSVPPNVRVAEAQFVLTAADHFALYVNGQLAGSSVNGKSFQCIPLESLLRPGTNTLAIAATNLAGNAGLTGRLDYRDHGNRTRAVFIDGSWRASSESHANWEQPGFEDSNWSPAPVLGNYGIAPWHQSIALPVRGVIYNASTNEWANRYPLRFETVAPVLVTNTAPGRWFIDFGKHAFGYAALRLRGGFAGRTLEVRFGEMADGTAVHTSPKGTVRYAVTHLELQDGEMRYDIRPPSYRGQTVDLRPVVGVVIPFRYLELRDCPGPVIAEDVMQLRLQYEFNDTAATFDSSSPELNRVWDLCRYSMKATSFAGVYVDGDRERKPYEADAYINQLSHYAVDREFTLARYSHEYLLANPTWPTEWRLHSILTGWADYLATGNAECLVSGYDILKTKLFLDRTREDGLMRGFPRNNQNVNDDLIDWPAGERDGFVVHTNGYLNYYNAVNNAFYHHCLRIMTQVAEITGHLKDAAEFSARARRVYESYNQVFWNPEQQRYQDGEGTTHVSSHANFFPLAFGLVPESRRAPVLQFLRSRGMAPNVYGAQYLLEALYEGGDADYAFELMTTNGQRGWLNMLAIGSTVTTEAWDFQFKPNMDWNHAWGAAPGNIISRYVLGLRPIEPGYGRVRIQPQLGSKLAFAEGTIPSIRGDFRIRADNAPNQYRLVLTIPGNVAANVMLPAGNNTKAAALVNGQAVTGTIAAGWLTLTNIGPGDHVITRER